MSEEKPVIASNKPTVLNIEPGTYWWCTCGKSINQPFCDGAHKGTSFSPQKFEVEEARTVALCNCKYTKNAPFCDGQHKDLP